MIGVDIGEHSPHRAGTEEQHDLFGRRDAGDHGADRKDSAHGRCHSEMSPEVSHRAIPFCRVRTESIWYIAAGRWRQSKRNRTVGTRELWTAAAWGAPSFARPAKGRRYPRGSLSRLTRGGRGNFESGCLHHDIAEHVRRSYAKSRQHAGAGDGGKRHLDIPAVGEEGEQRARTAMSGDRLEGNGADHRGSGIAAVGPHLLDALEGEPEVIAAAAVEDRQGAPAGGLPAVAYRQQQRGEWIEHLSSMLG